MAGLPTVHVRIPEVYSHRIAFTPSNLTGDTTERHHLVPHTREVDEYHGQLVWQCAGEYYSE